MFVRFGSGFSTMLRSGFQNFVGSGDGLNTKVLNPFLAVFIDRDITALKNQLYVCNVCQRSLVQFS